MDEAMMATICNIQALSRKIGETVFFTELAKLTYEELIEKRNELIPRYNAFVSKPESIEKT